MNHNQYHSSPERDTFAHQGRVQFSDGEIALSFRNRGDSLVLGYGSNHKYARHFDSIDMAWIRTKSGNCYGLAGGYAINQNQQIAYELPADDLQATVGEPLIIPGVGITTNVEGVLLRYKVDAPNSSFADWQIDTPSPFSLLDQQVASIRQGHARS